MAACLPIGCHSRIQQPVPNRAVDAIQPIYLHADNTGIRFVDRAAQAGLNYTFRLPGPRPLSILTSIGNGCAFLDFDGDGNLDILLVGGEGPKLYHGDGKGHFEDVTADVGLLPRLPPNALWLGCAVGDLDNDGYPDIYLSGYRTAALFHNVGGKRFEEITTQASIHPEFWGSSCGFADMDGDGRLDLFVANYVSFNRNSPDELCMHAGHLTGCDPAHYVGARPTFYHNLGNLRFRDESKRRGLDKTAGKGLSISFANVRGSGPPDVFLANDAVPSDLFHLSAQGTFVNEGVASGVSCAAGGHLHSGMGMDWGDYDNDGQFDALVTTFAGEAKSLYHNDGNGLFTDVAEQVGLNNAALPYVSFGVKWMDYDNDGWQDLILASGNIRDNVQEMTPNQRFRNPTQVLRNLGANTAGKRGSRNVRFANVSDQLGDDLLRPIVGRGVAVGDYDNDGRLDALVVDSDGRSLLLHNEGGKSGHWLGIRLIGTRSNRDGYGAVLTATLGKLKLTRQCQSSGSYLSASDKRVHFGLGMAQRVDRLVVRWPSGQVDKHDNLPADRYITLQEGQP